MEAVWLIWLICAGIAAYIGKEKNRLGFGLVLGLLFGVFGIIIISILPKKESP